MSKWNILGRLAKKRRDHIAEIYQTEDDPEGSLRMERELRRENILEILSLVGLIALGIIAVKVWLAYEGFSIDW